MTPDVRASFRDPSGFIVFAGGRIIRLLSPDAAGDLRSLMQSRRAAEFTREGSLITTRFLEGGELDAFRTWTDDAPWKSDSVVVEHDRVAFPSYPFEWPAEMLHAAGALTLRLARSLLKDGIEVKDATPYNVLFRGPRGVFIDALSFEKRDPHSISWRPYAQFVRTFILPLLLHKRFGMRLDQLLLASRDGVEAEQVVSMFGPASRLNPLVLKHVFLPAKLANRAEEAGGSLYVPRKDTNAEKAAYIFDSLLRGLESDLAKVSPDAGRASQWSDYISAERESTDPYIAAKREFLEKTVKAIAPKRVLDVGCNTGLFTMIAAATGASVVAIDSDAVVVGTLWKAALNAKLDILPLAVNITRPTPAAGWKNGETLSFLDRARAFGFDMIAMLGVIHHLCVSERVPLRDVLDLAADLTRKHLVIEYVAAQDPMFQKILRGRESLHRDWTIETFEATASLRFEVVDKRDMPGGTRTIFVLRKRS